MCSLYLGENLISGNKPINLGVRNIGEIFPALLPVTDAGAHLLDGSLILGGGIYQGFVDYIANLYTENPTANYFCTEAQWQQSVTTYGVCGKFVYDSTNNTVRLPKVVGKIDGTTDINALGDLEPLFVRLPNITGNVSWTANGYVSGTWGDSSANNTATGPFQLSDSGKYGGIGSSGSDKGNGANINFNASRSSSVYSGNGSNTAIHEQAIKCFIYIVIATSSKTEIQTDIDEIATDLSGKADTDLSNINASQSAKNEIISWGMPDYDNGIFIVESTPSLNYIAPAKGIICGSLQTVNATGTEGILYVNNNRVATTVSYSGNPYCPITTLVNKNDIITTNCYFYQVYFFPLKGAN